MVSVTIALEEKTMDKIDHFPWINWSEIAREEIAKKDIFERFLKTRKITDEDQKFCENIDWHPVDWLPLREEFVRRMKKTNKQTNR